MAVLTLAATGAFVGAYLSRRSRGALESADTGAGDPSNLAARLPSVPTVETPVSAVPRAVEISERVTQLMLEWRAAILQRNPEVVESLDRTFASYPAEFTPALMASAEGDPDQRVRAFSTRVLGKLRPPETVPLMRKLLADTSEHVRFNAAWALGELGDRDSVARLRQALTRDPAASVRRSAGESLKKMEGG